MEKKKKSRGRFSPARLFFDKKKSEAEPQPPHENVRVDPGRFGLILVFPFKRIYRQLPGIDRVREKIDELEPDKIGILLLYLRGRGLELVSCRIGVLHKKGLGLGVVPVIEPHDEVVIKVFVKFGLSHLFSSSRRHTRCSRDWSSDVCSSDLGLSDGETLGDIDALGDNDGLSEGDTD